MAVCDDRVLEDCSRHLTLSNLEAYSWVSRKKPQVLGAKEVHLVVQAGQKPESRHEEGVVSLVLGSQYPDR